jgi:cytochrome c-type biogenesis protein CcmH/NrfF
MAQCEHEFKLNELTQEVRCIKCINFDDEMELPNVALEIKEQED